MLNAWREPLWKESQVDSLVEVRLKHLFSVYCGQLKRLEQLCQPFSSIPTWFGVHGCSKQRQRHPLESLLRQEL